MARSNELRAPVWLSERSGPADFPPADIALTEPNGLLAIGGDLSAARLLEAYRRGIFPWYSGDQPILWWSPDPRAVIFPERLRVSRRLRRRLRQVPFEMTVNRAFSQVVEACAMPRPGQPETWITPQMHVAYVKLHELGHACSVECWREGELAGGIYGVRIGKVFFGESMFTRVTDASKVAMVYLCGLDIELLDCQVPNDHLLSMGATLLPRREFLSLLEKWCPEAPPTA